MTPKAVMSRRVVLAGAAGLVVAGCGAPPPVVVEHQSGVTTPPQAAGEFVAFDVIASDRAGLTRVLVRLGAVEGAEMTVSVGVSLFDERFGLGDRRPRGLVEMSSFPNDVLDPAWCGGDLSVQVCAESPERAAAVVDEVAAVPGLALRWRMPGFRLDNHVGAGGKPSATNLFGFTEGAGNPDRPDVWVAADELAWAAGGTYQVVRLIRLATPLWDADPVPRQEAVFGRTKVGNRPFGRGTETDEPDYAADPDGQVTPLDAHIRRANPRTPESMAHRILRRGYSYRRDGDEGMVFVCYQKDLERGFVATQKRLDGEALQKYVLPFGGGYFFTLPGGKLGESLLST
jgi:deferrochelatase/peroxidase EfeB